MSLELLDTNLLECALSIYETSGLEGLSLAAIESKSGQKIPSGLGLEDILGDLFLFGLYDHQLGVLAAFQSNVSAEEGIKGLIAFHLDWHLEKRSLAKFLVEYKPPRENAKFSEKRKLMNKAFVPQIMSWLMPRIASGEIRTLPPELYHAFLFAPVQEYSKNWLFGKSKNPPDKMKDAFQAAVWASLKGPERDNF